MKPLKIIWLFALVLLLGTSCSVTRHLPEGSYLVRKVEIEEDRSVPRRERITADEMEKYLLQTRNRRILGINFYVWAYEQANPEKQNWWNNLKRRIGEEPVLLDVERVEQSAERLKSLMDYRGFYSSATSFSIDTTSRSRRATVHYTVQQGEPYRLRNITYDFRDRFLQQIILPDTTHTLLRSGDLFDMGTLDEERKRIADLLKKKGYYDFSVNGIEYEADTLIGGRQVDLKMVVKQHLAGYDERGDAVMDNNMIYRLDRIHILPDYDSSTDLSDPAWRSRLDTVYYRGLHVVYAGKPNIRPAVLRQVIPLFPQSIYDQRRVDQTYSNIMSMGYFRSANISFTPRELTEENYVTFVGHGEEPVADTLQSTTREGLLDCTIHCTPTLRQGYKVELEGSTTSSFYGLRATVGYQNRNLFRGAEALDLSFSFGYEYMKGHDVRKRNATEFGFSAGLQFPRFLLPFKTWRWRSVQSPRTRIAFSINFQDRPYYRRTLSSLTWGYSWSDRRYSSYSLRPVDINVVDMSYIDEEFFNSLQNEYLKYSYTTQYISGLSFSYVYNNQRKRLGGNATELRFNFETAGNLLNGLEHLFSSPRAGEDYYRVFGLRYAQYVRADLSVSRKIMLGRVSALAGRLYAGLGTAYGNGNSIPFDRMFYAGGSNSMRGWSPRTLGPGNVPEPTNTSYASQLGDMRLEANLEFRFPIWGIVHGATFVDVGNVWYVRRDDALYSPDGVFYFDRFYKQLGFDAGIGIRLDIKFAVLRLDWGIQIHNPNRPAGERWIHNFRWANTALNFGVGYPF